MFMIKEIFDIIQGKKKEERKKFLGGEVMK